MFDPNEMDYGETPASEIRIVCGYQPAETEPQPWVSIVTPFFEADEAFNQTHISLLRQTLQSWEWIIVNDASQSTDSIALLGEVGQSDPRIKVIDLATNGGRSAARNVGIARARCDFIYMLDHDDLLEPTAIEKSLWCLISHAQYGFVNGWSVGFGAQQYLWERGFECGEQFLEQNLVTGRALFRRNVLEIAGGFDEEIVDGFEDWDLWLRCADNGIWGFTIPEFLDWFRRHDPPANWEVAGQVEAFREQLESRYPELFAKAIIGVPEPLPGIASSGESNDSPPIENPLAAGPKRILIALTTAGSEAASSYLLPVAQALTIQGWQVSLVALHEGSESRGLREFSGLSGPDVHVLANFLRAEDCPSFLEYLVQSRDPAVVILEQSDFGAALLSHLRSLSPRALYFCFGHHGLREPKYWAQRFVDEMPQLADETLQSIGPSDLGAMGVDSGSTSIGTTAGQGFHPGIRIPLGVDTTRWRPDDSPGRDSRAELGAAPSDFVIVFWGGSSDLGEIELLAAVLFELEKRGLPFKAMIAVGGSLREWLIHFFATHQFEHRVLLLETGSPQALRSALVAGDVFFQPGAGGTLQKTLFAMASGLPVVCHEASPFAPLVGTSCGGLIEPGTDADQIEAYAILLERLARDEEYRRRLSRAAIEKVGSEHGLDRLGQSIRSALASAKKRSGLGSAETITQQTREDLVTCCHLAPKLSWASKTYDRHQQLFLELDQFLSRVGSNPDPLAGAQEGPGAERSAEERAAPTRNQRIESIRAALAKLNDALADLEAEFSQGPNSIAAGVEVPGEPEAASTLRDALRLHWAESNRSLRELADRSMSKKRELENQIEALEGSDPARSGA